MIDLSFLTEEEAEAIMKVLQRDAVLKKSEEERVRHLPEKVKDDVQLKNMSGQWFYEAKSKRHRDKIHGADIIRASMRWKPAKLAEINCSPNTWVSNFNKEVFVPPELHVIGECQEQQQMKSISSSKTTSSLPDKPEKIHMKASIPSVKQRRNPFNSTSPGDNLDSGESENRPANVPQLPNKDEHQLFSKTDAHEVSNTKSATLQQGKPDLVEKQDSITTFKPDKHADELMEASDEAVSKDLLCFKRSSGSEHRKRVSVRPLGRQPTEKVDLSSRIAVLPTEQSGPNIDGKTIVAKELPFGKMKKQTSNPSASFISEDTQIKERMKPKKGEENEEQNDKSLIEYDCIRAKEKECGQEIKQQIQTPNFLEHQEQKLSAQKYESEKAIKEKRRIKEIRAFWERNKTIPSHGEKEASPNTNVSGGGVLKGLRECDRIKPTTVYRPHELDDQRKNMLRSDDLNYASQVSGNEHQNSFEFGPGHAVKKIERTVPSGGEFHEYTELAKPSNLQPRDAATLAFPETKDKDEKETLKGKVAAGSQQKPKFQVLSLKEKMNEKSGNQISDPSHFQSLRNFWDNGVKSQNSVDRGDFSLPNNTSSINYERKAKEDKKGRDNMTKQQLIQQQMQTSEREKTQKLYSVVCELPLGSPTLKGLNVTHTKNTDPVQLDKRKVISKPQEKMSLPEQAVKECLKKSIVSSKELPLPGDKEALKDIAVDDLLCFPIEKVENKTTFLGNSLPQEKVAETVDKVVLPKAEVDVFRLSLEKLEKEASETSSSLNLKENILKDRTFHSYQCRVFGRIVEQSPDISSAYQKEEISKNTGKMNTLSSDEHENKKSLRKLFREFEPFCLQHQAANKVDSWGSQEPQADLQNLLRETFASQPSEYKSVMKKSNDMKSISKTNCSIESTGQDDTDQPEEVSEIIEKSVAPSKVRSLSSTLKKLLEEASETPPPKPRCAESTVQRTAEMEVKNRTYEHNGDLLQEIRETIEMSVAPSKVSGLGSALKKLLEEATETPPPKPRCAESTIQRTAESEVKSRTYEHDGDLLQEISETIEKSVAPSKVSGLSSALKKLLEEASETPPPKPRCAESTIQRTAESEVKSRTYEHDGDLLQEISETIGKPSVLPKAEYEVFDVNLQKLLKEVSETPASVLENLGSEEELNPVLMVLKRSADRKMPSKSLEDIPSAISNKGKNNNPKEELALSAEDGPKHDQHQERNENASGISTVPSQPDKLFSNPEKLRLCQSVPSFLQEESNDREADTASESSYSFGRSKKSPSSLINLSSSSGKASLSPVSRNLMSICSADFDNVEVKGNIQFAIDYVEQLNELYIFIHQCKDLAVADVKRQRSDPYVKTYLHPEKYKLGKRKTSVKKNTLNPVYNETLRYKIEKDLLKNQSLNISVWHNDTFGRNSFLGQVELDLQTWDWNDISTNQHNWFPLKPRTLTVAFTPENRGEIKLALKYVPHHAGGKKTPSTGEVHIWVKKYCDPLLRGNRLNSFIHCTILPDNISGQKTRTVSKTTNPVFNCIMIYKGFKPEDLKEICIQLTIWDHNKFSIHFLGGLRIGLGTGKSYGNTVDWMDSTSDETALWKKIMNSPNTWIEDTLPLRMLKVEKLTK